MVDIHSHVLFGVDDGSEDIEQSIKSLKLLQTSGVTDIFLTSHYIIGEYDVPRGEIKDKFQQLKERVNKEGLEIKIHLGAEYYLTDAKEKVDDFENFTLGDSRYILVETGMNGFPHNLLDTLYLLVRKGYKPILAHPERYIDVIKNPNVVEDLVYRNVYMQANAGSFLGYYGSNINKTVWELFDRGLIHFIASDFHCHSDDYPLAMLREMFEKKHPDIDLDFYIKENPRKIISDENVEYIRREMTDYTPSRESFIQRIMKAFKK
jgi:protein-tyrosine phosphatase